MKKKRKIVIWVVVIAVVVLGVYYLYGRFFSSKEETQSLFLSPENIITVEGGDVVRTVDAFGQVRLNKESLLTFASSGIVEKMEVEEGEEVEKGKVLARLKNAQQESQLLQAENAYEAAKMGASASELEERELAYEAAMETILIKAPFSGNVAEVLAYEGDSVSGSTQIIYLVNRDKIYVDIDIDEVDIKEISVGQQAEIAFDAYPELRLPALVNGISPLATNKGGITVVEVTLQLTRSDPRIMSGFSAQVEITVEEVHNVVRIPTEAVAEKQGSHFVYLIEGETERIMPVKLGRGNDQYVEVLSGLKANDKILANAYQLFEQLKQEPIKDEKKGEVFPPEAGAIKKLVPMGKGSK